MDNRLVVKYSATASEFDLTGLGESFIGLNKVLNEYFEISGIDGDFEIRTEKITSGSVILTLIPHILSTGLLFREAKDLLDFLLFVDIESFRMTSELLSQLGNVNKSLNTLFNENPFLFSTIMTQFPNFLTKLWEVTPLQKNRVQTADKKGEKIPLKYAAKLHKMIANKKFKKVLKPIVENQVSAISLSSSKVEAVANQENFENFLPEEEQILPELLNGTIHNFVGEVLALQNTKGDTLKIKLHEVDPHYQLLVAYPEDGKDTGYYRDYYKKTVNIKAEIYRKSLYKKPELILKGIQLLQPNLL